MLKGLVVLTFLLVPLARWLTRWLHPPPDWRRVEQRVAAMERRQAAMAAALTELEITAAVQARRALPPPEGTQDG